MRRLFNLLKRYFEIKIVFRYARFLLLDGLYVVDQRTVHKVDNKSGVKRFRSFNVKSRNKTIDPVDSLYFSITKYKILFVTAENTYFFIKKKKRFELLKNTYTSYIKLLPYDHINIFFKDENKLAISNTVNGVKYKNHEKFDEVFNLLLNSYKEIDVFFKELVISNGSKVAVPFCVQHGDFKDSNIIWDNNNCFLIDLEAIGPYPLLFDLFFYVFISKTRNSNILLFSPLFYKKIKKIIKQKQSDISFEQDYQYIDYSLSIYLSYLLEGYQKEHTYEYFDYYFHWVFYDFINDDKLKMTKSIINSKLVNDKYYLRRLKYDTVQ